MTVIELKEDSEFASHLNSAGKGRLVVIDFSAAWCGPCNMIAPFFKELSTKNPSAMFMKVDVDKCPGTAAAYNVSAMPTFVFLRDGHELDRQRGADKSGLEAKVKAYLTASASAAAGAGEDGAAAASNVGVEGEFIDLNTLINKSQSECLNQSDDHTWEMALNNSPSTYLESDCDNQLLLLITFQQAVKLNSMIIQGPANKGPKELKLFINQTRTLDFDSAESNQAVQSFELKPEEISDNNVIKLRYVKFQNVQNITLFFNKNQTDADTTVINYIKFIGAPLSVTNMNEFKRVSGQAGEAHG